MITADAVCNAIKASDENEPQDFKLMYCRRRSKSAEFGIGLPV
jgi:hypothetical protein